MYIFATKCTKGFIVTLFLYSESRHYQNVYPQRKKRTYGIFVQWSYVKLKECIMPPE